jgi:hypothetical protein
VTGSGTGSPAGSATASSSTASPSTTSAQIGESVRAMGVLVAASPQSGVTVGVPQMSTAGRGALVVKGWNAGSGV